MQETKSNQVKHLKHEGFVVYEKVREYFKKGDKKEGGGVAIAAKLELNPALISEGEGNVEALTIDIHTKNITISCTSAYGPQKKECTQTKDKFWAHLGKQAENAMNAGKGFILQGDLNAKLGPSMITGDPKPECENGKRFKNFLKQHKLFVVNSLSLCEGLITRMRKLANGKLEESVIDFYVVCERVLPYVTKMIIDSDRKYSVTNYSQIKQGGQGIDSDHNTMFLKLLLQLCPTKIKKRLLYNLKNAKCQTIFKNITEDPQDILECFMNLDPLQKQCSNWKRVLEAYIGKAFRKIKIKNEEKKLSEAGPMIDKRNKLKSLFEKSPNEETKSSIEEVEKRISEILTKEGVAKSNMFKQFCNKSRTFPVQAMWKLKKKVWPKKPHSVPVAKYNHKGKLIGSPLDIMAALSKEYTDRLRSRKVRSDFIDQKELDNIVTKIKLSKAWEKKSEPFKMSELNVALKDLNKGKSRDPAGLCSEIFHPSVIGKNLKISLLLMLNKIKSQGQIADFMNVTSVTSIPKTGSKFLLTNERGIFKVSVFRTILLKILYNRNYETIDYNMSESNIGARKRKSCRNHIWILNGINFEHNKYKHKAQLVAQFWDYKQMFDSMSVIESTSDMYNIGMKDDSLVILNNLSTNITMTKKNTLW